MLVTAGIVVGGGIYVIGSITTLNDLLKNGKSLDDYRKKYGKDLGMLICCTYRGGMVFAWPVMGLVGFSYGLVRDTLRLMRGKGPKGTEKE